ncbi:MAG TPA: STAS domain-containing protein [Pseudonocardia sp.]|nr:STAS domain-containing protein [Pseudonocardia sp.]
MLRSDTSDEPIAVLTVHGEVDTAEAAQLRRAGSALLGTTRTVAVDLSGVTFFGSRGITALVELHHGATTSGTVLWIITGKANRAVLRPLALTGLDSVLRLASAPEHIADEEGPVPRRRRS